MSGNVAIFQVWLEQFTFLLISFTLWMLAFLHTSWTCRDPMNESLTEWGPAAGRCIIVFIHVCTLPTEGCKNHWPNLTLNLNSWLNLNMYMLSYQEQRSMKTIACVLWCWLLEIVKELHVYRVIIYVQKCWTIICCGCCYVFALEFLLLY